MGQAFPEQFRGFVPAIQAFQTPGRAKQPFGGAGVVGHVYDHTEERPTGANELFTR